MRSETPAAHPHPHLPDHPLHIHGERSLPPLRPAKALQAVSAAALPVHDFLHTALHIPFRILFSPNSLILYLHPLQSAKLPPLQSWLPGLLRLSS